MSFQVLGLVVLLLSLALAGNPAWSQQSASEPTGELDVGEHLRYCGCDFRRLVSLAEARDPIAQYFAACKVLGAESLPTTRHRAFVWLTDSANDARLPAAQALLAARLLDGTFGRTDVKEAARLALDAANAGNERGQLLVRRMYVSGEGVRRDRVEALMWTLIAAYRGSLEEEDVWKSRSGLTKAQQAEAVRRVFEWKRLHPHAYPVKIEPPLSVALRASGVPIRKLDLHTDVPRVMPGTRFGGVPWWPKSKPRPTCGKSHPMSFVMQIRMMDVPGTLSAHGGLLSFHYCLECGSYGRYDDAKGGYDVTLLAAAGVPDGLPYAGRPVKPRAITMRAGMDYMSTTDASYLPVLNPPVGRGVVDIETFGVSFSPKDDPRDVYRNFTNAKLGGWPSWVQDAAWPTCKEGRRMALAAQLGDNIHEDVVWEERGRAYLFVCPPACKEPQGDLVVQV